jgi:hypothetical protein
MTTWVYRLITLVLLSLSPVTFGQEFKRYRGAKFDQPATDEVRRTVAAEPGLEVSVYLTADPFDKVYAFYRGAAHEYSMPGKRSRKLPTGQELRDAFFLLDGAPDLVHSKLFVKIQRPFIGSGLARGSTAAEVRDITAIVLSQKK